MKRRWLLLLLTGSTFLAAACGISPGDGTAQENATQNEETSNADGEQQDIVESQVNDEYYRPVITEGAYQPSQSRGITLRLNSNVNLESFESGLMRLSQKYFPTEDHFFQEGQFLPSGTVTHWLQRESENYPEGLNPEDNGKVEEDERNPIYLQTLLEQDYYVQTDEGLELAGISIGLGMNKIDYYRKEQFGSIFESEISRKELLEQGQRMADEIVSRMRSMEEIPDVPIVVGIFEQSPSDDLAGGVYIAESSAPAGSDSVSGWTQLNHRKAVFPLAGTESNEGNSFANFKSEVESFFPNLSGVVGIASYVDDQLIDMSINITTQFYGEGEMIAFTQFVNDAAETYLPLNIPIEITIDSIDGVEAFLFRETGSNEFKGHIFN